MIRTSPAALARARDLLAPALRDCLGRMSPEVGRVVGYHFGLTDADGRPSSGDGGKAVRPALALLSAEAAGAPAEVGLPGALAVELVHNFSLLHDDVMDNDLERRHRPTAWALFGVGQAIVTGDALLVLAQEILIDPPSAERSRAAVALSKATAAMIAGQAEDLAFESRLDVSVEECRGMSEHKTGALLSCASSIGAILAGAEPAVVDALAAFGLHLGLSFQAVDDVLGIWGDPEVTGKPAAGDLLAHKKTLPVAIALRSGGAERDALVGLLSNGRISEETVPVAVALLERCGAKDAARREADRELDLAMEALRSVTLDGAARDQLAEVARFVAARDF